MSEQKVFDPNIVRDGTLGKSDIEEELHCLLFGSPQLALSFLHLLSTSTLVAYGNHKEFKEAVAGLKEKFGKQDAGNSNFINTARVLIVALCPELANDPCVQNISRSSIESIVLYLIVVKKLELSFVVKIFEQNDFRSD